MTGKTTLSFSTPPMVYNYGLCRLMALIESKLSAHKEEMDKVVKLAAQGRAYVATLRLQQEK
jgi:hypothetical protein